MSVRVTVGSVGIAVVSVGMSVVTVSEFVKPETTSKLQKVRFGAMIIAYKLIKNHMKAHKNFQYL